VIFTFIHRGDVIIIISRSDSTSISLIARTGALTANPGTDSSIQSTELAGAYTVIVLDGK